jgi:PAS domain S-box-containing protein
MAQVKTKQHIRTIDINKKIISNIDNGIIILDDELFIYHYNRWLELNTKIKESEVLDKKLDDIFPNIKTKTLIRKIKTALRIKTPTFYTASTSKYLIPIKINQIKNSKFQYMQQDVSIIPFDEEKNLVALILTDQTIMANTNTLLQENIQKVKELNAELIKERETIDKKILFIKLNNNALITDISQALLNLLEYKEDELINKNFFEYEKENISKKLKKEIIKHMNELKVFEFEYKTYTKNHKELWIKNSLVPEYNSKAKHIGFILFKENITDSKIAELHHKQLLSNSRSAAMGEMISMIAHQWRQPLSLINTIIATIKVKKELGIIDDNTINNSFEKIENTVSFLSETINDFRDYFKPNKIISKIKLNELFNKSISFLKDEMSQSGIQYHQDIDPDISINTYKNELVQSIINIIKNSIDAFNGNNSKNKIINVKAEKLNYDNIRILIQDNAGGITPEILKKVFDPYFSTKSKNGTGLGLYMCKTIIDEHLNGRISISSKENMTKTIIELPYNLEIEKGEYNESSMPTLFKRK